MKLLRHATLLPLLALSHLSGAEGRVGADVQEAAGAVAEGGGVREREIVVDLPGIDQLTFQSITPTIRVRITRGLEDPDPDELGVRVSLSPLVDNQIIVDTAVVASDSADITVTTPLPSGATVYLRGFARSSGTVLAFSSPSPGKKVPEWLALIVPGTQVGSILEEPSPTFTWSSARVATPPGPWVYDVRLARTAGGPTILATTTTDTTLLMPFPLEFSTSYRFSVTARLAENAGVSASTSSSFVIINPSVPRSTLLHQPFPNPFPSTASEFACVWFDLAAPSHVILDVLDLRTNRVRRIFPPPGAQSEQLPAGRYGRSPTGDGGCGADFHWDGTDDRGRAVRSGVYIVRLRAGGRDLTRQLLFRGREP